MTITRKIKIRKFWKLVFLSIRPIADLSCKFEKLIKKLILKSNHALQPFPIHFSYQKWSNLHERSGIGWIERKTKFLIFATFISELWRKNTEAENSLNAIEQGPVPTTVLNPNTSYKLKQCSYRRTKIIFFF